MNKLTYSKPKVYAQQQQFKTENAHETHTSLNVCYVWVCGIVQIRPHAERLIHFHCVREP